MGVGGWGGEMGMSQQQVNSKKDISLHLSSIRNLLARQIKAELGSEVPQLSFQEYIV
jgi:hypothetical protein